MTSFTGLQDRYRCGFIIKTFQGSIPDDMYSDMMLSIESLGYSSRAIHYLNEDTFYTFKNRLNSLYPRYVVTITKFEDLDNVTAMESWQGVVEPRMYNIGRGAVPASNPTISKLD
jgi:hypothetical protein